jgi:hypothetical protein
LKLKLSFETPEQYSKEHPIHMGVFAHGGVGKTTFAGTSGLRTLLLDCGDAGAITLRKVPRGLRIIRLRSSTQFLDAMDQINRMANQIDLLVIDTLTGLQTRAIKEIKGKRGDMNQRKWGQVGSRVIECLSETENFPKDVLYLMQEKNEPQRTRRTKAKR